MLFKINSSSGSLEKVSPNLPLYGLELERYLITQAGGDNSEMSALIFGEPLLLVSNQVRTSAKKRADILALDRAGNGVIIELKREGAKLGVETQALQYLADFSNYRGKDFLRKFAQPGVAEDTVLGFVGDNANMDEASAQEIPDYQLTRTVKDPSL